MVGRGFLAPLLLALAISQSMKAQTPAIGKRVFTLWQYEAASVLQSATISQDQICFFGIRPSGSLLLQRLGSRLEELSEKGEKTGEWSDSEQGARQCLAGDTLVRILRSGTIEFIPLGAPSNPRAAPVPSALASGGYAMEAISDNVVIAIQRASAHMVRIEVDAARFTEYQPVREERVLRETPE